MRSHAAACRRCEHRLVSLFTMNEEREILTTGTVVYMAGEPWILEGDVSAKKLPEFRCPHCGGTQGTWFDRTFAVDADGNEVEPMCDRCCECGKNVNQ